MPVGFILRAVSGVFHLAWKITEKVRTKAEVNNT